MRPPRLAAHRLPRRLRRDEGGATIVEFALVFPVFLLAVFGAIVAASTAVRWPWSWASSASQWR